jgi:hypothetical protein
MTKVTATLNERNLRPITWRIATDHCAKAEERKVGFLASQPLIDNFAENKGVWWSCT